MEKTLARAPIPLAVLVAASANAAGPADIVADLTETVALPAVNGFADAAGSFEARVGEACAQPSKPDRAALEAAYADLADAHARVEILGFGPYTRDDLGFKLAFWPDKHNVAARRGSAVSTSRTAVAPARDQNA